MLVQDIDESAAYKLSRLNDLLEQLYGLQIDYDSTPQHLREVYEHYSDMRVRLLREGAAVQGDSQYAKALLISEALRIFLREIAPKRIRKKKKG